MKKDNLLFGIIGAVVAVIASMATAYATTILFASENVTYDNTSSGISATNVKSAITELHNEATDYSALSSLLYPVGSIFITTCKKNDGTALSSASCLDTEAKVKAKLGGTWSRLDNSEFFLVGAGTYTAPSSGGVLGDSNQTFTAGTIGGAEGVLLTAAQSGLSAHNHDFTNPKLPNHVHTQSHGHTYTKPTISGKYNSNGKTGTAVNGVSSASGYSSSSAPYSVTGSVSSYTGNTGNATSTPQTTNGAIGSSGSDAAEDYHENRPPYLAVYMYRRVI